MGLLSNPFRSREPRLPVYENLASPTKERASDDEYDYSDDESDGSYRSESAPSSSSRNVSASAPSGLLLLPKRKLPRQPPKNGCSRLYPYRLPTKITRWVLIGIVGTLVLMLLSLVRASQVENWKVANGRVKTPPPPPPVWESFPFLERYYGGIRTLRPLNESQPSYPATSEHAVPSTSEAESAGAKTVRNAVDGRLPRSSSWETYPAAKREAGIQECFVDAAGKVRVPPLRYYSGRTRGFPGHVSGSYEALGLPEDICFERYGRYGPYGFGYSRRMGGLSTGEHGEKEGHDAVWEKTPRVDYRSVDWADVQRRCYEANIGRYKALPPATPAPRGFYIGRAGAESIAARRSEEDTTATSANTTRGAGGEEPAADGASSGSAEGGVSARNVARTAVVVRCWDSYLFREDDVAHLRSVIAELSMGSGGRYDVHLLVQVKEDGKHPVLADHEAYQQRVKEAIPREFQGLVTLWTETQMLAVYQGMYDLWTRGPVLPVHGVYRGHSMAMQHFAYQHPEYDYFWQWEMDVRYTGHYYDLVTKLEEWAKAQPRKGLWERNSRFYLPSAHGTWDDFSQMSRVHSEMGTAAADNVWSKMPGEKTRTPAADATVPKSSRMVWGPVRPAEEQDWFEAQDDPVAPTTYEADKYSWGVGEEADYISLNPIFDPEGTTWALKDDITGYNRSRPLPPRRAAIITTSRMSRRLLVKMHRMTAFKKQFAFPEMWPATVALQHGYKAVYAPHPMYVDRRWPVEYMAQTYNGGRDASSGGSRTSVFGEREHNLKGLSWFYNSGFAPNLYRRWLGLKVNNDGGEDFEQTLDETKQGSGVGNMRGGEGRMCVPAMLLHPVKDVELPVEAPPDEDSESESVASDPAA
ncbi:uncharacterized protein MAM_01816 [Metarhizium album ARSEF 1941]|uniref:Major facilitator superfamily transporter n=1 Tax=Metarhizium album (strain ARSEF 1941) TaxID=1081103 RepID=A0A0B2X2D2_METAS|nr:uncharacterized protein MAM_01816 [Metarhizium album ARSEF 1941]KHN99892.1 hypothetical protein MAM_01816 [Metarhizium album ARSEF 1941]